MSTPTYPLKILQGHAASIHDAEDNFLFAVEDAKLARHVVDRLNQAESVHRYNNPQPEWPTEELGDK